MVPHGKAPKSSNEKTTKTKDVKCFRCLGRGHIAFECPTKRTVILKDNGEYTSESSASEEDEEEAIEIEVMEGLLMIRRLLEVNYKLQTNPKEIRLFILDVMLMEKFAL